MLMAVTLFTVPYFALKKLRLGKVCVCLYVCINHTDSRDFIYCGIFCFKEATFVCVCVSMYACIYTHIYIKSEEVNKDNILHIHAYMHACTYMHTNIHTYIHTYSEEDDILRSMENSANISAPLSATSESTDATSESTGATSESTDATKQEQPDSSKSTDQEPPQTQTSSGQIDTQLAVKIDEKDGIVPVVCQTTKGQLNIDVHQPWAPKGAE
jgi:hypothetical protein